MEVSRIYFDMDGVLADFDGGVRELCGMTPLDQGKSTEEQDDKMWAKIRDIDHFYSRLNPMPGAKEMFDAVFGKYGGRCEILTGIPKERRGILHAGEDKTDWMGKYFSEAVRVNIVLREEKIQRCTGLDAVLIDDLEKTIEEWRKAGGTGILHRSSEGTLAELKRLEIL